MRLKASKQQQQTQQLRNKKQQQFIQNPSLSFSSPQASPFQESPAGDGSFGITDNDKEPESFEITANENEIVGTPYWMAPEVIKLKGPKPASGKAF